MRTELDRSSSWAGPSAAVRRRPLGHSRRRSTFARAGVDVRSCGSARNGSSRHPAQGGAGSRSSTGARHDMIERVIYAPEAEQDVADAYGWYEAREPGLGEDFLRCVERACSASNGIPSSTWLRWMIPAGASPAIPSFSMSGPRTASPSILSFTALRTRTSGVRGLGISE